MFLTPSAALWTDNYIIVRKEIKNQLNTNDNYFVDRTDSKIYDNAGNDIIYSSVSYDMSQNAKNIENITLLEVDDPFKTKLNDGSGNNLGPYLVYGHPTIVTLDYLQGDNFRDGYKTENSYSQIYSCDWFSGLKNYIKYEADKAAITYNLPKPASYYYDRFFFRGTCSSVSLSNIFKMDRSTFNIQINNNTYNLTNENGMVGYLIESNIISKDINSEIIWQLAWANSINLSNFSINDYEKLFTKVEGNLGGGEINSLYTIEGVLDSLGLQSTIYDGSNKLSLKKIADLIESGHGVIMGLNNNVLTNTFSNDNFKANHVLTLTGVVRDNNKNLIGFYSADSGMSNAGLEPENPIIYLTQDIQKAYDVIWGGTVITDYSLKLKKPTGLNNAVYGNNLSNTITGNSGNNILNGLGGIDTIDGKGGVDQIFGGSGDDTLKGGINSDHLFGDADNDKLEGGSGNNHLFGGTGNDHLYANTETNQLGSGTYKNYLTGGAGNDFIYGTKGNDIINGDGKNDNNDTHANTNSGKDIIFGNGGNDKITSGPEDDIIVVKSCNNIIDGGTGNDIYLFAASQNDSGISTTTITDPDNTVGDRKGVGIFLFSGDDIDIAILQAQLDAGEGHLLKGKQLQSEGIIYQDPGHSEVQYQWDGVNGSDLKIYRNVNNVETTIITVKDFINNKLGINLVKKDDNPPDDPLKKLRVYCGGKEIDLTSANPDFSDCGPPGINKLMGIAWNLLQNVFGNIDPLVFDLDNDGIESTSVYSSEVFFDLDNDTFDECCGWISADDGLLIIDQNNNGNVDDIGELFGDRTTSGFEELKLHDSNADGKIDVNDANFSKMKIWQDYNQNGFSDFGEMKTLDEVGINSINLNYQHTYEYNTSNIISEISTYELNDGTTRQVADVNLGVSQMKSDINRDLEVTFDVAKLPSLRGYGVVKQLQEKMMLNPDFKNFVGQLSVETDIIKIWNSMDDLLAKWTGADSIDPDAMRGEYSARRVAIIERFMGQQFTMEMYGTITPDVRTYEGLTRIDNAYQLIKSLEFTHFIAQTALTYIFDGCRYNISDDIIELPPFVDGIVDKFIELINTSDEKTAACLSNVLNTLREENYLKDSLEYYTEGKVDSLYYDIINGNRHFTLSGSDNDILMGAEYNNNLIYGEDGDDLIYSNSIMIGGKGNDTLIGHPTNDTYIYNIGDGKDIIGQLNLHLGQALNVGHDVIKFGPDISSADLVFKALDTNLIINFKDADGNLTEDMITIIDGLKDMYKISELQFNDGSILTSDQIVALLPPKDGTSDDDTIDGTYQNDIINAYEGNDTIYGFSGDDVINAGPGNDHIMTTTGNSVYIYNYGDGQDVIEDGGGDIDKIQFGEGITQGDLKFVANMNDLIINIKDTGEKITITGGFATPGKIEILELFNGISIGFDQYTSQLEQKTGTLGNDVIFGSVFLDTINGLAGDDAIYSYSGDDVITGGQGNDNISSDGNGATTYIFNLNDGQDTIFDHTSPDIIDRIEFGPGINPEDIEFKGYANHLLITVKGTGDSITVTNGLDEYSRIEQYNFADGSSLTHNDVLNLLPDVYGTTGNDILFGSIEPENITAYEGDDVITAYRGDDVINAGSGNDTTTAGGGTYIFNAGDGQDTIHGVLDKISFGPDVFSNNLEFTTDGKNLIILFKDNQGNYTSDKITILKYLEGSDIIGTFEFNDGTALNFNDVFILLGGISGTEGDDILWGSYRNDTIKGNAGNDQIYADNGNNILEGGTGNDYVQGGDGDDTYIFNAGDGQDTIADYNLGTDKIKFGPGITSDNLMFTAVGSSLIITMKDNQGNLTGDKIEINSDIYYYNRPYENSHKIELIEFADGSSISYLEAINLVPDIKGTLTEDVLYGSALSETIYGYDGNDTIWANYGGASCGTDIIIAGKGNDYIDYTNVGYDSSATFIFNKGDGQDTITTFQSSSSDFGQTIQFGPDITKDNIEFTAQDNNLIITIKDNVGSLTGDKITVNSGLVGDEYYNWNIEKFEFADGSIITNTQSIELREEIHGTTGNDNLIGSILDDFIHGNEGNDYIYAHDGNDIIIGCFGNDELSGRTGNDTYIIGVGHGQDKIMDNGNYYGEVRDGGEADKIKFIQGITIDDLDIKAKGSDIIISFKDEFGDLTGDTVTIYRGLEDYFKIESLEFDSGTTVNINDIITEFPEIIGTTGNDTIDGTFINDIINGLDGNDIINAYQGDDIITGGKGNDTITDLGGNDTYYFGFGDGQDTILDPRWDGNWIEEDNVIKFGSGITQENLSFTARDGSNVVISLKDNEGNLTGDKITLLNCLQEYYRFKKLEFEDGTYLTYDQYITLLEDIVGTDSDDIINGSILGDRIYGGEGNDTIMGDYGLDTISGSPGNDMLNGWFDNDNYVFNIGDGQDMIFDGYYGVNGGIEDKIIFGEGITPEMLFIAKDTNYNVIIFIKDENGAITSDKITIQYGLDPNNAIEKFVFADGTELLFSDIQETLPLLDSYTDDTVYGSSGNDTLYCTDGNDTLTGGAGNDYLYGGLGDDNYVFSYGDGVDTIFDHGANSYESGGSEDKIIFGTGITLNKLVFEATGSNLIISLKGQDDTLTGDKIIITNGMQENHKIESIQFLEDSSTVSFDTLLGLLSEINGTNNDDTLEGTYVSDKLNGLAGNDIIYAKESDDIISGGPGSDTIYGDGGDDSYLFNFGDGKDIISDDTGTDKIVFGENISASNLQFNAINSDLIIKLKDDNGILTGDEIRISNGLVDPNKIETIEFYNGTFMTQTEAIALVEDIDGTAGNDVIYGSILDDKISGLNGSDTIYGNDGNDTYFFNSGNEKDTISDTAGTDKIVFGENINASNLQFNAINSDLIIKLKDDNGILTGDEIRISNGLVDPNKIETIEFYNGTFMTQTEAIALVEDIDGTAGNDVIYGSILDDKISGLNGSDTIYGNDGNDTYFFNAGNGQDIITDTAGIDKIVFGNGIETNKIVFKALNTDLIIQFLDEFNNIKTDEITITNGLIENNRVETFEFYDGSVLTYDQAISLIPVITGTVLNDTLTGSLLDDQFFGNNGNDSLYGGMGNDTYIFNRGNHHDTINDYYRSDGYWIDAGLNDKIIFGPDITKNDLSFYAENNNVIINILNNGEPTQDKITITNQLINTNKIEILEFSDGSTMTNAEIFNELGVRVGTDIDDTIIGSSLNDIIFGLSGNDRLIDDAGNNTLIGGAGNDTLQGGIGDDIYSFNSGDGQDTILDSSGSVDKILFGPGISSQDLSFTVLNSDLIVTIKDSNDKITISNGLLDINKIENFEFSDGSNLTYEQALSLIPENIIGTVDNDSFNGSILDDNLFGFSGDDTIRALDGNDIISGGPGSDNLEGGFGQDTYIFNIGDGEDSILDLDDFELDKIDKIFFGEGIEPANVVFAAHNTDLVITFNNNSDKITISNGLLEANRIESFEFNDGSTITYNQALALIPDVIGTSGINTIEGSILSDNIYAKGGDDTILALDGDDNITGGTGSDNIFGGAGNDTYLFNKGDGKDIITDITGLNDRIKFGSGITIDNLVSSFQDNTLHIWVKDSNGYLTSDKITIINQFTDNTIENLEFSDGTIVDTSAVEALPAIVGTDENDPIMANEQNNTIYGLAGDDEIYALRGNDTVNGGKGDDYINLGLGQDTILFRVGDGQDTIIDNAEDIVNIIFDSAITKDKVIFQGVGTDLVFGLKDNKGNITGDKITFSNGLLDCFQFNIKFADETLNISSYQALLLTSISSTPRDDVLLCSILDEDIDAGSGNDNVDAGGGDDTIIAGAGDDIFNGGSGNDTYIFSSGNGQDTIIDTEGIDKIQFGTGITTESIVVTNQANDLLILFKDTNGKLTNDKLTITDQINGEAKIELFEFSDGRTLNSSEILELLATVGSNLDDIMDGSELADSIYGLTGNDTITGLAGNDYIEGNDGNDTLTGGIGYDTIKGGDGDDTYIYNLGDGKDIINDNKNGVFWYEAGIQDRIVFGTGITADKLVFSVNNTDLIINIKDENGNFTDDEITIQDGLYNTNKIERYDFSNGYIDHTDVLKRLVEIVGSSESDSLDGSILKDTVYGYAGNDAIITYNGNDIINAGAGNDYINGGTDSDTYIFNLGDGNDTIYDAGQEGGNAGWNDKITFGAGITPDKLVFKAIESNLIINIKDETGNLIQDSITIKNGLVDINRIEKLLFNDGNILTYDQIVDLIPEINGTAEDNSINGSVIADKINGLEGNDTINANNGDDILNGGAAGDLLYGSAGNDTYIFNSGDGNDTIKDSIDNNEDAGLEDRIVFGTGINQNDLIFTATNSNLIIGISTNDSITIQDGLIHLNKIEKLEFSDGTTLSYNNVIALIGDISGSTEADIVNGSIIPDTIYGLSGNDTIYTYTGDDLVVGGTGNDTIYGSSGNQTFKFGFGDGIDSIYDDNAYTANAGNADRILFDSGLTISNLDISNLGTDLIISLKDNDGLLTGDQITVNNWLDENNRVEIIEFADGSILNEDQIITLFGGQIGIDSDDTLNGTATDNIFFGKAGNDVIEGLEGNDFLDGGTGNDTLTGGIGNDIYVVDNAADIVIENPDEGTDEIRSYVNYTLPQNVETLSLLGTTATNATGNELDNIIKGNVADNIIDGGSGADIMIGGSGNDTYSVDNVNDVIVEGSSDKYDAVNATVSYTLNDNIEYLTLLGNEAINGTGNSLDNIIIGNNANNILDGSSGSDFLIGNDGDDIYIVDKFSDYVIENENEGTDEVRSNSDYMLYSDIENLILTGTDNISGTGNELNNLITGNAGDNILSGGLGNDTLIDNDGSDTYIYNLDDGQDTIIDTDSDLTKVDKIKFGDGISESNLRFTQDGNDLVITINDSLTSSIRFVGHYNSTNIHRLEKIVFNDGTELSYTEFGQNQIDGSISSDNITGTSSSEVIYAMDGDDTINAGDGYDIVYGGSGNDIIDGGPGEDTLFGGIGNDTFIIDHINDTVIENTDEGTDEIKSSVSYILSDNIENLTLTGNDYINGTGNDLNNFITGNSADNDLDGALGTDTLIGGAGNDNYIVDNINDCIVENADEGNDTVYANFNYTLTDNFENLILEGYLDINGYGNSTDNTITGNEGFNTLYGYAGNDTLDGGEGIDTLIGGVGDDTYILDTPDDTIVETANEGIDTVQAGFEYTLADNLENLTLLGYENINGYGSSVDNVITGNDGNNVLNGHEGNDTISGGYGIDEIHGDEGDDIISGNEDNDTLYGGIGNDQISGDSEDDILYGEDGNDTLDGGSGLDTLAGGLGDDTYIVYDLEDTIVENAGEGNDTIKSYNSYTLIDNIENITLIGEGEINATGNNVDNILTGNYDNNTLEGLAGNDTLTGDYGDDILIGGINNDILQGDSGNDTYIYNLGDGNDVIINNDSDPYSTDVIKLGEGITQPDIQFNTSVNDLIINILSTGETIKVQDYFISDYAKVSKLVFNDNTEILLSDIYPQPTIEGDSNDNNLTVTIENLGYRIIGHEGNDTLTGLAGNDILDGGPGIDTMAGGNGYDTYIVDNTLDVVTETETGGYDIVQTSVDYTAPINTELLQATGSADITLTGNAGFNVIQGNSGNNTIYAGDGFDFVSGGDGNDNIYGEAGSDYLDGEGGADNLYGGLDDDTYIINDAADAIFENVDEGIDEVITSISYTLSNNVENIQAEGNGNINLTGNNLSNQITGNTGNNNLYGLDGDDVIAGYGGDDYIAGGKGSDYIMGSGATTYFYSSGDGSDYIYHGVEASKVSQILFDANITQSMITVEDVYGDLVITFSGSEEDSITISNHYGDPSNQINKLVFSDGSEIILAEYTPPEEIVGTDNNDTLTGTASDDIIRGLAGNDTIDGLAGNDSIYGGQGDDQLYGGEGNDTIEGNTEDDLLNGGVGTDTLIGGAGNDTYIIDNTGDTITENTNEGIDLVQSSLSYTLLDNIENLTLTGTADINATGNNLNNILTGNSGNNILDGKEGNDTLTGGMGNDTYIIDSTNDVVTENDNEGTDLVKSTVSYTLATNLENLTLLGSESINATGNELNNVLIGNSGDNILDGGIGTDAMEGGLGNDTYIIDNQDDYVLENADEGIDTIKSTISYALDDNFENLTLTGTEAINGYGNDLDNVLTGNAANNILNGGAGSDSLIGGAGDDTYVIDNINDSIFENADEGTDEVASTISYTLGSNLDKLYLLGTDSINGTGNDLDNTIVGNDSDNIIDGKVGADILAGAKGNDNYIVDNTDDAIVENLDEGIDSVNSSVTYGLADNIENLTLIGTVDINGYGNSLDNIIAGNNANNILNGGVGADTLTGKAGDDIYVIDNINDKALENANEGNDKVYSTISYTLEANIEDLILMGADSINGIGNELDNVIVGNDSNNIIDGKIGADIMAGESGNDTYVVDNVNDIVVEEVNEGLDTINSGVSYTLDNNIENLILVGTEAINATGNDLNNIIIGNASNNTLTGGAGSDILDGYSGTDTLLGGTGADTYIFNSGYGNLTISDEDFNTANVDILQLGPGIVKDDLIFSYQGNDLVINFIGSTDKITILGELDPANTRLVEKLVFADGSQMNYTEFLLNTITGTNRSEKLTGTLRADLIKGLGGNDKINSLAGNDIIYGGNGNDDINSGEGNDVVYGEDGNDEINVFTGNDIVYGGTGNDKITGCNGNKLIYGEDGNDCIITSSGNDTIYGDSGNDIMYSDGGNDTLFGGAGNDILTGGAGDDYLDGGAGHDLLYGGTGNDTYIVDSLKELIFERCHEGIDTVKSSISYDLLNNFENLVLTGSANINGTGNKLDNVITGNSGNNKLYGESGSDKYIFSSGAKLDSIFDSGGHKDEIAFDSTVLKDSIAVFIKNSKLTIDYGNGDVVTVNNQTCSNNKIEKVSLSDGTFMTNNDINNLIQQMSAYATNHGICLGSVNDVKNNQDLMNMVMGSWHA